MKSDLTWIAVSDLDQARHFFFEKLNMKEVSYSKEYEWSEFQGKEGGGRIGLAHKSTSSPIKPGQNGVITLTVSDIKKVTNELKSSGVKMIGETIEVPNVLKMQFFVDDDNNHYQLVELDH